MLCAIVGQEQGSQKGREHVFPGAWAAYAVSSVPLPVSSVPSWVSSRWALKTELPEPARGVCRFSLVHFSLLRQSVGLASGVSPGSAHAGCEL